MVNTKFAKLNISSNLIIIKNYSDSLKVKHLSAHRKYGSIPIHYIKANILLNNFEYMYIIKYKYS